MILVAASAQMVNPVYCGRTFHSTDNRIIGWVLCNNQTCHLKDCSNMIHSEYISREGVLI